MSTRWIIKILCLLFSHDRKSQCKRIIIQSTILVEPLVLILPFSSLAATMVATVNQDQEEKVARWQLVRRLKRHLHLRKIHKNDAKVLQRADDDDTLETLSLLPRTLSDALPEDPEERAKGNTHAIVVTECTGAFNMIGCNKAWENLCGYEECEIVGKDSSILQGPDTNHIGE